MPRLVFLSGLCTRLNKQVRYTALNTFHGDPARATFTISFEFSVADQMV
jgi:hypothetical protein